MTPSKAPNRQTNAVGLVLTFVSDLQNETRRILATCTGMRSVIVVRGRRTATSRGVYEGISSALQALVAPGDRILSVRLADDLSGEGPNRMRSLLRRQGKDTGGHG